MGTCIANNVKTSEDYMKNYQNQKQFTYQQRQQVSLEEEPINLFNIEVDLDHPVFTLHQFDPSLTRDVYQSDLASDVNLNLHSDNSKQVQRLKLENPKEFKRVFKELRSQCYSLQNYILPNISIEYSKNDYYMVSPIINNNNTKEDINGIIRQVVEYNGKSLINMVRSESKYVAIYCMIILNENIRFIDSLQDYNLNKHSKIQQGNMNFYQILDNQVQNSHLPNYFHGNYICELLIQKSKRKPNLMQLKNDLNDGLYLLSYQALKEHMKRRFMKQYHLWSSFCLSDNRNKPFFACAILVNYLKKQHSDLNIEEELRRISKGGTMYFTFDRIKCLDLKYQLSQEELNYVLSSEIVKDVIQVSLSNARILMQFLEEKFSIKIKDKIRLIGNIDSHYFTSKAFCNNYNFVESFQTKTEPLMSMREKAYDWLARNNQQTSYELYLPSIFYNLKNVKFYIPNSFVLSQWIEYLKEIDCQSVIQDANLLMQIQNSDFVMETQNYDLIQYQLFDALLKGYYLESQFQGNQESQRFYEIAIKISRQCFGDFRNRGSILYPIEAFCWHRLSVFTSQNGDVDYLSVIQYFFSQFIQIPLPCNNIQCHNYKNKDLIQVLRASIKGFMLYDWLFKRFNELQGENIQSFEPQFCYQPGQIILWGFNQNYQLGQMYQLKYRIPISLKSDVMFVKMACGYKHTMAISNMGKVYCWGNNEDGKCGKQSVIKYVDYPHLIESSFDCISIECGHDHSVYVNSKGGVYSWGCGEGGLLGNNTVISTHIPQQVMIPGPCKQMKCGGLHNAAIVEDRLYVWGRGDGGQLGLPLELGMEIAIPTKVEVENVQAVACGDAHTIILNSQKQVYGWGYNEQGQLGLSLDITSVVQPTLLIEDVDQIYAGSLQSYFLKDGNLYGCGCNDDGQLGIDTNAEQKGIQQILNYKVESIAIGQDHTLCQSQGKVYGWGLNKFGELCKQSQTKPTELFAYKVQSIGCGAYHSGVVISGTEKYSAYNNEYDYKIQLIE
ncbi:unnamed protein product (macronuclear) [Paramecium tetraurelia]|uniref:RCC1-like domain-containing protein n=1 Tax=Paramecium tetraurelia TaxID=5888 RepID=A0E0G7_PARTE|nr:uncharacterized protein GSPATT00021952001 [Paramecium tetraurelia]CAK88784.1 unnamed protein product [Paramecium tetraurelia]|eukprot:XP_001456181.1 hypothetical protein (macronuclear) [Paramecium tetraurelia strain d4-2]